MDSLRIQFERAEKQVNLVAGKLARREFLTNQDFNETVRLLNDIDLEQQRLLRSIQQEGIDIGDCRSLDALDQLLEEVRKKREQEELRRRMADAVFKFLCIESTAEEHKAELQRLQDELYGSSDEELEQMEKDGRLDGYRKFTELVKSPAPDRAEVFALRDQFGYQMAFAVLAGQLVYREKRRPADSRRPETRQEPSPEAARPAVTPESGSEYEPEGEPVQDRFAAQQLVQNAEPETPAKQSTPPAQEPEESEPEPEPAPAPVSVQKEPGAVLRSTFTLPDHEDFPFWEAWDSFKDFREKVSSLPKACRILLPALTQLGVLDLDLTLAFCSIMGWDTPWKDRDDLDIQMERSLWLLAKQNLAAEYKIEGQNPLYCLTEYAYRCLHEDAIQRDASKLFRIHIDRDRGFHIAIGSHDLFGWQEMDRDALLDARDRNAALVTYFTCLKGAWGVKNLSSDTLVSVLNSLNWTNGHYVVKVPGENSKLSLCTVYHDLREYPRSGETLYPGSGGALFVTPERPDGPFPTPGPAFFATETDLWQWDGRWYEVLHVEPPEEEEEVLEDDLEEEEEPMYGEDEEVFVEGEPEEMDREPGDREDPGRDEDDYEYDGEAPDEDSEPEEEEDLRQGNDDSSNDE